MSEEYYNKIQWDEDELHRWRSNDGDNTHLLNWDLNSNSRVIDVGSYNGDWLQKICNKYNCYGLGYEPTKKAFNQSLSKSSEKLSFMNCGITTEPTSEMNINVSEDQSTFVRNSNNFTEETVKMINAKELFENSLNQYTIDLIQINIEGYEYNLLPYMIDNNLLNNVKRLQVQFHNISEHSDIRRKNICSHLNHIGFETKFDYKFVWYGAIRK